MQSPDGFQWREAHHCSAKQSFQVWFRFLRFFPQTEDGHIPWHLHCSFLSLQEPPAALPADEIPLPHLQGAHHSPEKAPDGCCSGSYPGSGLSSPQKSPPASVPDFQKDHRPEAPPFPPQLPVRPEECPAIPVPVFHLPQDKELFPDDNGFPPAGSPYGHILSEVLPPEQYYTPVHPYSSTEVRKPPP